MKGKKWVIHDMSSLNLSSIFLPKSQTQSYYPTFLRKKIESWEVCATTLFKLPQNWLICIGKVGPNNIAQVTTILGNLFWKYCQLIKKC